MGRAWTVRPGRPEDTPAVLELFEQTFGKPLSEAAYRWKLLESPWPLPAPATFVATAGDRVVGHLGGTPLRLRLDGRDVPAVHVCDGMVAEDFRRRGIMTAIGLASNRAWTAGGAALLLALPTQNWVGLRGRLDYRPAFGLGWLWRPLRLGSLLAPRLGRGIEVSAVETPGPEFDALWEAIGGQYEALVVRDRAWVTYRYAAAPGFGYRILLASARGRPAGYLVYRVLTARGRPSAWIADLFTAPDDRAASAALVRAACSELRRAGAAALRVFAASGTLVARHLWRVGFLPRRGAYDVRVGPLAHELPWSLLRDPSRFFLMGGDFDVI